MKNIFIYDDSDKARVSEPQIIIQNNNTLTVDGIQEIKDYSCDKVIMSLGKINVTVTGDSLVICTMDTRRITLSGNIFSVSFSS